jgi:hypothetical protein
VSRYGRHYQFDQGKYKEEESAIEVICRFDYYKYWFPICLHMLKAEIDITEGLIQLLNEVCQRKCHYG